MEVISLDLFKLIDGSRKRMWPPVLSGKSLTLQMPLNWWCWKVTLL